MPCVDYGSPELASQVADSAHVLDEDLNRMTGSSKPTTPKIPDTRMAFIETDIRHSLKALSAPASSSHAIDQDLTEMNISLVDHLQTLICYQQKQIYHIRNLPWPKLLLLAIKAIWPSPTGIPNSSADSSASSGLRLPSSMARYRHPSLGLKLRARCDAPTGTRTCLLELGSMLFSDWQLLCL